MIVTWVEAMYWEGAAVQTRVTDKREGAGKTFDKNRGKLSRGADDTRQTEREQKTKYESLTSASCSNMMIEQLTIFFMSRQISRKKGLQRLEPDACGRYSIRDCSGYEKIVLISDQVGAHLIFVSSYDS